MTAGFEAVSGLEVSLHVKVQFVGTLLPKLRSFFTEIIAFDSVVVHLNQTIIFARGPILSLEHGMLIWIL